MYQQFNNKPESNQQSEDSRESNFNMVKDDNSNYM